MENQRYLYKCPAHGANLYNMRLNNKGCDVIIRVEDKDLRAHKLVLAANLKYFESMFFNTAQVNEQSTVSVEGVKVADLEVFITYAYTGEILLTDSNALNLLEAAIHLTQDNVKEACIAFLEKHLRVEDAFRAYNYARAIDCRTLQNAAKFRIQSNFKNLSMTSDYLDFDYANLADILSDGKPLPIEHTKMLFEGIIRWIMYDAKDRKIRTNDLLSFVDLTGLSDDDLKKCLKSEVNRKDADYEIIKEMVLRHRASSKSAVPIGPRRQTFGESSNNPTNIQIQQSQKEVKYQSLMIIGITDLKYYYLNYDFIKKKWSAPQRISRPENYVLSESSALNDKLYYITQSLSNKLTLHVFNPATKRSKTLVTSSGILQDSAVCACDQFLYFCGGGNPGAALILKYDPRMNSFETLTPMPTRRHNAAAIFYEGCLYVLCGHDGSYQLNMVEKYDPRTRQWTVLEPMLLGRFSPAVAALGGKLYVCGGFGRNDCEVYDPSTNSWTQVASMNQARSSFLLVPHEGKLLAVGGGAFDTTVEVYDPSVDRWEMDYPLSAGIQLERINTSCVVKCK